jgi:GPH family glycoside/pentoside/hexuronide:cation symporter
MEKAPTFSTGQRLNWAMASFGGSLINGIYGALLPIFYVDYLGLVENAAVIYWIQLIYVFVNALNDPIFGFISDRTRSRRGRRIPYMRLAAPFLSLSFILIWFSPHVDVEIFWWMVIMTCVYDTAYTIIFLVYSALLPEITENEQERQGMKIMASFFNLIGMILGFIIPDMFRNQSLFLLQMSMIAVGVLGGALIMYTTYKFKERPEFTRVDAPLPLFKAIKATLSRKSFIVMVAANFMAILIQSLIIGSLFYVADYITQSSTLLLLVALFLPLIIGIWIVPRFTKKWGVAHTNQYLLALAGIGLILLFIFTDSIFPSFLLYVCLVIAGFGFVGPLVLNDIMFFQITDEDELKSGVRREAAFFGINALITKPAQSLAIVIPTALLAISGFIPRSGTPPIPHLPQPAAAILAIRLFIGLIPGIALILASLILIWYPLKGEHWADIQQKILVLHEEKARKLKALENS